MSEKLLRVTASDVIKALMKAGFSLSRQGGSHKIYTRMARAEGLQSLIMQEIPSIQSF